MALGRRCRMNHDADLRKRLRAARKSSGCYMNENPYDYRIAIYEGLTGPEKLIETLPKVYSDWMECDQACRDMTEEMQERGLSQIAWPDGFLARPAAPVGAVRTVYIVNPESRECWPGTLFMTAERGEVVNWNRGRGAMQVSLAGCPYLVFRAS